MLYAIAAMIAIIIDQAVKYWVTMNVAATEVKKLLPGILSIVNVQNDGAAFSFLAGGGARIPFIIITGVFTLAVILMLASNFISGRTGRWCLVMIMAGGLSNCIDRILYGYVVDMFKVELFNFAVFNVADIFVTVFCILFIIYILFGGEKNLDDDEDDDDGDDYDDEDDEDDDDEQSRPSLLSLARSKIGGSRSSRKEDEYDEEDEYERYKAERNARQAARAERQSQRRQDDYDEYEEPRMNRGDRRQSEHQSARQPARQPAREPMRQPARQQRETESRSSDYDPFAEWEKANARAENRSRENPSYAQQAMGTKPAAPRYSTVREEEPAKAPARQRGEEYAAPARQRAEEPAASGRYSQSDFDRPARQPAPKAAPKPAPKPAAEEEFSLDDILNEFK